ASPSPVAVGFVPETGEGEALALLAERAAGSKLDDAGVERAIRECVSAKTGVAPGTIRLLAPGTLPRTSSGKLRRAEALRRFLAGELTPPSPVGPVRLLAEVARST